MPSRLSRAFACLLGLLVAALLVAGPLGYWSYRRALLRNLHEVVPGVLYRSGQMRLAGLEHTVHELGIRTVISLRDSRKHPELPPPDAAEEQFCNDNFLNYHRLPASDWSGPDGSVPADVGVQEFLKVMRDPANYPVLIHCFGGIHRAGAYCAVYRMEFQHWSNEQAIEEMVRMGYAILDEHPDVRGYLEQYQPRWRQARAARPGHEESEPPAGPRLPAGTTPGR